MQGTDIRRFARQAVNILDEIREYTSRGGKVDDLVNRMVDSIKADSKELPVPEFRHVDVALGIIDGVIRYVEGVVGTDLIPIHVLTVLATSIVADSDLLSVMITSSKSINTAIQSLDSDDMKMIKWVSERVYSCVSRLNEPVYRILMACADVLFRLVVVSTGMNKDKIRYDVVSSIIMSTMMTYLMIRYKGTEFINKVKELDELASTIESMFDRSVM